MLNMSRSKRKSARGQDRGPNNDDINTKKLLQLIEIFPDKSVDLLKSSLDDVAGDLGLAISLILSSADSIPGEQITEHAPLRDTDSNYSSRSGSNDSSSDEELLELYSMFPDIDTHVIKSYYNSEGRSLYKAICDLLSYEMLSVEDREEQRSLEARLTELRGRQSSKNSWDSLKRHINLIMKYTQVDERTARQYYYNHFFHPIPTIIAIIHEQKKVKLVDKSSSTLRQKGGVAGHHFGRVQSQRGFAYARGHMPPRYTASKVAPTLNGKPSHQQAASHTTKSASAKLGTLYLYSDNDPKMKELKELLKSSPVLSGINPTFLRDALTYYEGDTEKTLDLCCLLAERDGIKYTFLFNTPDGAGHRIEEHSHGGLSIGVSTSPRSPGLEKTRTSPVVQCHKVVSNEKQLTDLFNTYKLDFHGYLPQEAVSILRTALEEWWNEEIALREQNKIKLNLIEVRCVRPLIVITGRGIHSVGGISKVRIQVKKLLESEMFVFDERPSFFTVYGKKSY